MEVGGRRNREMEVGGRGNREVVRSATGMQRDLPLWGRTVGWTECGGYERAGRRVAAWPSGVAVWWEDVKVS